MAGLCQNRLWPLHDTIGALLGLASIYQSPLSSSYLRLLLYSIGLAFGHTLTSRDDVGSRFGHDKPSERTGSQTEQPEPTYRDFQLESAS